MALTANEIVRLQNLLNHFESQGLSVRITFNARGNDLIEIMNAEATETILSGNGLILDDACTDLLKNMRN